MKQLNEVARMQQLAGLNESFDSLVHKLEKQGKSEKAADKIAGAINTKYVHHYREGVEPEVPYDQDWLHNLKEFCQTQYTNGGDENDINIMLATLKEYIREIEEGEAEKDEYTNDSESINDTY